jgi:hypothetical protein
MPNELLITMIAIGVNLTAPALAVEQDAVQANAACRILMSTSHDPECDEPAQ